MGESKGIRAAMAQQAAGAPQAAGQKSPDEVDVDGYEYRVILHGGLVIQVISQQTAPELAVAWQQARKADAVVQWNGDQFTEARQVAHIESVIDDEAEGEEPAATEGAENPAPTEAAAAS